MRYLILLLFFTACSNHESKTQKFVIVTDTNDEWVNYEGNWMTEGGMVHLELALKAGAHGLDAEYRLRESFSSDSVASGTTSNATYSTFGGRPDNTMGIVLRGLAPFTHRSFFRYRESIDLPEEMFFLTRGQNELLPCDPDFKPLTSDRRYTLHRRSDLLTVEGYVTFDGDSVEFFERNAFKYYDLINLGEFNKIESGYKKWTSKPYEGMYVKALAYTVFDSTARRNQGLVMKRVLILGSESAGEESQIGLEDRVDVIVKKN